MTSALHVPGARAALRRQRKSPNPSACHGNWNEQHSQPGAEAHSSVAERDWGCAAPKSAVTNRIPNFLLLEEAFPTGWSTRV